MNSLGAKSELPLKDAETLPGIMGSDVVEHNIKVGLQSVSIVRHMATNTIKNMIPGCRKSVNSCLCSPE